MTTLEYKKKVEKMLYGLKRRKDVDVPALIATPLPNGKILKLKVITDKHVLDDDQIKRLALWRDRVNTWFPSQFIVTHEGTKKWAKEMLMEKADRILFFMYLDNDDEPFGHVGLYRFNYKYKTTEIDNVIRGVRKKGTEGAMTVGLKAFINWTFAYLGVQELRLQVFSDNFKAITLYERVGFREIKRVPVVRRRKEGIVLWEEIPQKNVPDIFTRYNLTMVLSRDLN